MHSFCLLLVPCRLFDWSLIIDYLTIVGQRIRTDKPDLTAQVTNFANAFGNRPGETVIPVVESAHDMTLVGAVTHDDVMTEFTRVLIERRREELGHE